MEPMRVGFVSFKTDMMEIPWETGIRSPPLANDAAYFGYGLTLAIW